jgi:SPP1 gp7 family putative phage head morphogenesis protein
VEAEDLDPEPQPEQLAPEPVVAAAQDAPAQPAQSAQAAEGKAIEAAQFRRWLKKKPERDIADFEAAYLSPVEIDGIAAEVKGVATEQPPFGWPASITPEWVKALVLQLDPGDDEAEQLIRMAVEDRTALNLGQAMEEWRIKLLHPELTEAQVRMLALNLETPRQVRDAIEQGLIDAADLGVSVTVAQMESVGFGFDFTLANIHAREWATRYAYDLVSRIEDTTRRGLQEAVTRWVDNGQALDALRRDLEPLFGGRRARLIASTETTNVYAHANEMAAHESGVVDEMEACTARDERVCPVCGVMHGQRRPIRGTYPDGKGRPSWHPGCRCWERPVVRD